MSRRGIIHLTSIPSKAFYAFPGPIQNSLLDYMIPVMLGTQALPGASVLLCFGFQVLCRTTDRIWDHCPRFPATKIHLDVPPDQPCLALDACCDASLRVAVIIVSTSPLQYNSESLPSSNKAVSTALPGKCTYLTTLPLMKTFLTDD